MVVISTLVPALTGAAGFGGCAACCAERNKLTRPTYRKVVQWGMATETSYSKLRENLASVLDRVVDDQEVVIVRRKNAKDVALVPASELASLTETAYLLRSPRNARRLLAALRRAERGDGEVMTIEQLRRRVGLGPDPRA
jgi:antitoxin YefM